jgi:glutamine amidotransferase
VSREVCIIDYGAGNIQSVFNAVSRLGYKPKVTSNHAEILNSKRLILPGVGSFKKAMESIASLKIDAAVIEALQDQSVKILGICLGMQLLALNSTEDGYSIGFGLIPASVDKFSVENVKGQKIPHIGFNQVNCEENSLLLNGIERNSDFYFVHSYRMTVPANQPGVFLTCDYGEEFLAGYENENVFATQFHPEKSQSNGLKLLTNFLKE